jgi:hypothetical protein
MIIYGIGKGWGDGHAFWWEYKLELLMRILV